MRLWAILAVLLIISLATGCASPETSEEVVIGEPYTPPAPASHSLALTHADMSAMPADIVDYSGLTEYHVAVTGDDSNDGSSSSPFATPEHAVSVVGDSSVVYIHGGTYRTDILTITQSNFVLAAYPGEKAVLKPSAGESTAMVVDGDVHDVVVADLTIDGFETGIIYGSRDTQENLVFRKLVILNGEIGIENAYLGQDNYLVDGLLVKDSSIYVTGIGLQCGDEEDPCAKNVLVDSIVVMGTASRDDTGYDSLAMVNSDNIIVKDSKFSKALGDGLDFKATRVSVVNCIVSDPNRNGMKFWNDGEIIGSTVSGTGADAAIVFDASTSDGYGFRMVDSVVKQHGDGERSYAMTFNYDTQTASDIVFEGNTISSMPGPIYINPDSTVSFDDNSFSDFDGFIVLVHGDDEYRATELNGVFGSGNSYS